jgi:hypothetical protein
LGPLPSLHAFDGGLTVVSSKEWLSARPKNPFKLLKQEPSRMLKLLKRRMPFGQNGSDGSNRWQKKQEEKKKKTKTMTTYQALQILSPKSTDEKKRTLNIISKYPMNT